MLRSGAWVALLAVIGAGCGRFGYDDGGDPVAACAQPSLLTDDFDGNALSGEWFAFANTGVTTSVGGGVFEVTPGTDFGYGAAYSKTFFDLRGERVFVEVAQATEPVLNAQTSLEVRSPERERLQIVAEGGALVFGWILGPDEAFVVHDTIEYVPAEHRFWQLREQDGVILFETSADGASFVTHAQAPAPFDVSLVRQQLGAGARGPVVAPGVARFEAINGGGPPRGRWCPAADLEDDFDDGARDATWARVSGPAGCSAESGGWLSLTPAADGDPYCVYGSALRYDLRDSAVHVELVSPTPVGSGQHALFELRSDRNDTKLQFVQQEDVLIFRHLIAESSEDFDVVTFDPAAHRFLRYAHEAGVVRWQASPDGATWTTLHARTGDIDPGAVSVYLAGGRFGAVPDPQAVAFDNVNGLPAP